VPLPGGPMDQAGSTAATSIGQVISLNWSGYAATSSAPFTYVHTRFVQPAVTCPGAANEWTSNWAGLDGFTTATVEQDGTYATCGGPHNMTPQYEAWYEMFPAGSVNVFPVHAGDVINASVRYAHGEFTLTVSDLTSGKTATDKATCASCERASAEWILERPAMCNNSQTKCFVTKLADFNTSTMAGDRARVAGAPVQGVGAFTNYPIDMVNPLKSGFISLDTVSALSGNAYTATWDRSGTTVPISA
jgi:Peptidase A4 family